MKKLPFKMRLYIFLIYLLTTTAIVTFYRLDYYKYEVIPSLNDIIFFGILAVLTNTFAVNYKNVSFSPTFAITSCVFILYGPLAAAINIIIGQTFKVIKVNNKYKHVFNTPFYGTVFNYCTLISSLYISAFFFIRLGGKYGVYNVLNNKISIIVFFIIMFTINNLIIATLSSITSNKSLIYCFINNFRLISLSIFAMAPFGVILAFLYEEYSYPGVTLMLIPVILSRYTFHLYIQAKTQYLETIDTLMKAIEARDQYTEGHSQRVGELSVKIARVLKYSEWKIEDLKIASMLHDVGKIGIRDHILNKPGKLDNEEFEIIKSHPEKGFNILKSIKNLEQIVPIVRHHHERYDGKGYPDAKSAEELSLDVFIVQLADSIDAMSTDRPYRKALKQEEIIEEVKKNSGTQFHPKVVEAYLKIVENEGIVRR